MAYLFWTSDPLPHGLLHPPGLLRTGDYYNSTLVAVTLMTDSQRRPAVHNWQNMEEQHCRIDIKRQTQEARDRNEEVHQHHVHKIRAPEEDDNRHDIIGT